jgi:hypothetical protein
MTQPTQSDVARAVESIEAAWRRPCPTCGADAGEPCLTKNGYRTALHEKRREAR